MSGLSVVASDYREILRIAHRRWINERSPAAADAFDRALRAAVEADRTRRNATGRKET
jgi:hypothetical protein